SRSGKGSKAALVEAARSSDPQRAICASPFLAPKSDHLAGRSLLEKPDQFHVRGKQELVDRRDLHDAITRRDKNAGIACEGRGITRYCDDSRRSGSGKLARLRLGALPRRIEYHGIEAFEFTRRQRAAQQVALLRRHRLEPRSCRRAPQGCDCVGIAVDRGDAGALGQTKCEWPDAAEQVSDCARVLAISRDQLRQDRLARTRRLQERSWRKYDLGAADRKHGAPALCDQFAVAREPRKISALRDAGERC